MLCNVLFFSYMSGFMVFLSMRSHLLLTLISVEFIMVILYMMMFYTFNVMGFEFYFLIIFLVFLVCEGSLGLSILVSIIRSHGNDMINSLYMMLW